MSLFSQTDSSITTTRFSGSLGVTTNGFSIIPTFSLNSPALITVLSWRKKNFSIDPDIRLTPDLKKGGMIVWFRYYAVDRKKFNLRIGAHPALNFQQRTITENGNTTSITQMRRFLAWELAPTYNLTKNWNAGIYYLQGNGLQKDGPVTTHFVTFNSSISDIHLTGKWRLMLAPAVYYLYLDGFDGKYFTMTGAISNTSLPLSLESTINKTFASSLAGNKDFMWNLTLNYHFDKTFKRIN